MTTIQVASMAVSVLAFLAATAAVVVTRRYMAAIRREAGADDLYEQTLRSLGDGMLTLVLEPSTTYEVWHRGADVHLRARGRS